MQWLQKYFKHKLSGQITHYFWSLFQYIFEFIHFRSD